MNSDSIVQKGDPVLGKIAREVSLDLIGGKTLNAEIKQMKSALKYEFEGVALAAPQIGVSKRMFIVSGRVFGEHENDQVFINPTILKKSKKARLMDEGCLSVRYWYGQVKRHTNVTISYYDESGNYQTRGAGGLLAHIFQHEIDHLDGILFIDKAEQLEELKGKDKQTFQQQRQNFIEEQHGK